jgi:hypothetical protein
VATSDRSAPSVPPTGLAGWPARPTTWSTRPRRGRWPRATPTASSTSRGPRSICPKAPTSTPTRSTAGRENLLSDGRAQGARARRRASPLPLRQKMGRHRQTGIVACALVEEYERGPHQEAREDPPDKEDDRTRHIETLEAHDEPVFLTYRADAAIDDIGRARPRPTPSTTSPATTGCITSSGSRAATSRWRSSALRGHLGDLYVADGHHRSAAASRVHGRCAGDGGEHDVFLAVVFPHDQMQILPYNRVVRDTEGRSPSALEAERERMDVVTTDEPAPDVHGVLRPLRGRPLVSSARLPGQLRRRRSGRGPRLPDLSGSHPRAHLRRQRSTPRRARRLRRWNPRRGELERRVDAGEASIAIYLHATEMSR